MYFDDFAYFDIRFDGPTMYVKFNIADFHLGSSSGSDDDTYYYDMFHSFVAFETYVIQIKVTNSTGLSEVIKIELNAGNSAIVKSSIGIGTLLSEGIGDTVRVSLTDDPVEEIYAAREILKAVGMVENPGMDIVACPTCGRTKINLIALLDEFKKRARAEGLDKLNIKVALMGCVVNGPGEAREADLGIAGGNGEGLIFKKGEIIRKVDEARLIDELINEIKNSYLL